MAAGAGQHRDSGALVRFEGVEGLAQRPGGGGIDRVAAFGPVEDDGDDGAAALDQDAHIRRSFPSQKGSRSARRSGLPTGLSGIEGTKRTDLGAL